MNPEDGSFPTNLLAPPTAELTVLEIRPFLTYMFSDLATKTHPLKIMETYAFVRRLMLLAASGVSKNTIPSLDLEKPDMDKPIDPEVAQRNMLRDIAFYVWSTVLQYGEGKPCSKVTAERFLKRHRNNWYEPHMDLVSRFLEEYELPTELGTLIGRPALHGQHRSVGGGGNHRLDDDLSERIAAAYFGLQRSKVRGVRKRVVEAMKASPIVAISKRRWDEEIVWNRVRKYKRAQGVNAVDCLVNIWISQFRFAQEFESSRQPNRLDA